MEGHRQDIVRRRQDPSRCRRKGPPFSDRSLRLRHLHGVGLVAFTRLRLRGALDEGLPGRVEAQRVPPRPQINRLACGRVHEKRGPKATP